MELQDQINHWQARNASRWFEILKHGRAEDRSAFVEWCRQSPLHIQEFLEITCTDRALDALDVEHADDVESLLAALSSTTRVLPLRAETHTAARKELSPTRARRRWAWAIAASFALLATGWLGYERFWHQQLSDAPAQEF
ncbi:MAG TPA: hypothetical protein VG963_31230, partial [Polyangiaceae bacterium]|nr:hypothetical protein [Polyangiaceae bacterium]